MTIFIYKVICGFEDPSKLQKDVAPDVYKQILDKRKEQEEQEKDEKTSKSYYLKSSNLYRDSAEECHAISIAESETDAICFQVILKPNQDQKWIVVDLIEILNF
jgi:hypothetical protein